ncbi:MAG: PAS domain S-box protein [Chloroflexi bacterium]|nr:PAS domain S-box protein [Chloroflexota bacterium]
MRPILDSGAPITTDQGIIGTVLVFRDASEQMEAEAALTRRTRELEALVEIANLMARPGSFEEKAERVLAEVVHIMDTDRATFRVPDRDGQELRLVAGVGSTVTASPSLTADRRGQGTPWLAFDGGEVIVENDYASLSRSRPELVADGIRSVVSLPITIGSTVTGILTALSRRAGHFTADRVRLLTAVAHGMGVLLESARAETVLTRRTRELEALVEMGGLGAESSSFEQKAGRALEILISAVEGCRATLRMVNKEQQTLRRVAAAGPGLPEAALQTPLEVPWDVGFSGEIFTRNKTLVLNDYPRDARRLFGSQYEIVPDVGSVLGVPVRSGEEVVGALSISCTATNHFSPERVQVVSAIARGIGAAFDKAKSEAALLESEERTRKIIEYSNDAIFLVDPARDEILDVNPMACRMLGYTREELMALPMAAIHPLEVTRLQAFARTVYEAGHGWTNELTCTTKGGEALPVEISASTFEQDGRPLMISIVRDTTEHRRAEEALRLNAAALEHASNGIVITDTEGTIQWVNPAFTDLTGYESHEVIGQNPRILKSGKQDEAFYRNLWETISSGHAWHGELINRRKDGSLYVEEETITPVLDPAGRITNYVGIKLDVSQRKANEAALQESEERYRAIFESSPFGIGLSDLEQRILDVNEAFCQMVGYSKEELIGSRIAHITHPEDRERGREAREKVLRGEIPGYRMEKRYITKDKRVIWGRVSVTAIRDNDGKPVYALSIVEDVTERKLLQEQLIQAQKMEVVGQLAGGVAHDFNNLLTPVLGFAQLGMEELPPDHPVQANLQEIKTAGERGADLVRQLMIFSRQGVARPVVRDANKLVLHTDRMLRRLIGENIELVGLFAPEPMDILIDPGQMEQVLVNMVVNARDAMPDGGKLTIETAIVTLDEASARRLADLAPGEYVRLSVTDTGIGMDAEVRAHLFEPFFTTKGPDKGTGLGLATCYGIITQAEGAILVRSEPGQGSTFDIYLPKAEAENVAEAEVGDSEELLSGTETVLLVEDEPSVRRLGIAVLERQGYNVLEAANGEDALSIAEEYGGQRIQLLLTDLVMPQMGGRALAGRLHDRFPGIRVLFTSGFQDECATLGDTLDTSVSFLPKPFTPGSLARQVRRVLDAGVPA